jgi:hypothetical protein
LLGLVYGLLALAILIALIGIVNTLMLSVFERIHEIGLLPAVGMKRRQVRATVRSEAIIIDVIIGTGLGIALASTEQVRPLGIEVRAGVHNSECELRDGDIAGMAVHIGARVGARAGSGEVLVSSTVKDLVVGSGLRFEERGAAR